MVRQLFVPGLVAAAIMQGCAAPAPRYSMPASPACSQGNCSLQIKVTDCSRSDGFSVSVPSLPVHGPSRIEWTIDTPDYSFRQDVKGIDIPWGSGVFDEPKPIGHKKFSWRDKHADAGAQFKAGEIYYYFINIKKDGGPDCTQFDPWISNW